jgi:hypothetical protein
MPRSLPISFGVRPGTDLEASNCANLVLNAYTMAMMTRGNEPKAYEAAIRAWQERNPDSDQTEAARAVANIICNKL